MLTVDLNGNWGIYTNTLPNNVEVLGTVTRHGYDTGALVRFNASGNYAQVNAGVVRCVNPLKAFRALQAAKK